MTEKYIIIEWPDIQYLMDKPGFRENSYLINDRLDEVGSSAYFVNEDWFNKQDKDESIYCD